MVSVYVSPTLADARRPLARRERRRDEVVMFPALVVDDESDSGRR